jgi:ketosteroid isomerase-like protein
MIDAYSADDQAAIRALLSDDLVAYVTNADAGVDRIDGADAYVGRLPNVSGVEYSVTVTQSVTVAEDQVLAMVEVKATRNGRSLHNHAAFLSRFAHGRIAELWMVDALPSYSDEFWS